MSKEPKGWAESMASEETLGAAIEAEVRRLHEYITKRAADTHPRVLMGAMAVELGIMIAAMSCEHTVEAAFTMHFDMVRAGRESFLASRKARMQ